MFQRLLRTLGIFAAVSTIGMGTAFGYTFRMSNGAAAIGDGSTSVLNFGIEFAQEDPAIVGMRATITYPEQLEYVQGGLTPEGTDANNAMLNPSPFSHTSGNRTIVISLFDFGPILNADTILATLEFRVAPGVTESGTVQVSFTPNITSNYVTPDGGTNQLPTLVNGNFDIRKLFNAAGRNLTLDEDSDWTAVDLTGAFTNELGQPVGGAPTGVTQPANGESRVTAGGVVEYMPDPNYFGADEFTYTATATVGGYTDTATVTVTVNPVDDPPVLDEIFVVDADTDAYQAINPAGLSETGPTYQVALVAYDIDTDLNNLTATASDDQNPDSRGELAFERKEIVAAGTVSGFDRDTVWFWFDFPVDQDTVVHPDMSKTVLITGFVSDDSPLRSTVEKSLEVTIADVDRPPVGIVVVTTDPSGTAFTTQSIAANPNVTGVVDPDGDALTPVYSWSEIPAGLDFDTQTLPSTATTKGEVWEVTVGVSTNPYGDGIIYHADTEGAVQVDIVNTDPVLGVTNLAMFIQKNPAAQAGDTVTKAFNLANANPQDDDNDALQYIVTSLPEKGTLQYEVSAPPLIGRAIAIGAIDSVPFHLPQGETVRVIYTVTDPTVEFFGADVDAFSYKVTDEPQASGGAPVRGESSNTATVSVTYRENQPPEVVVFSPEAAAPMDEVIDDQGTPNSQTFAITFNDDGDPSGNGEMDRIEWYVSEDDGSTWTLQGVPSRAEGDLDGEFTYVTDYDTIVNGIGGHAADKRPESKVFKIKGVGVDTQGGETEHVWDVTVNDVDRLPSAPVVEIDPENPYTDDDLLATVTTFSTDPDGDTIVEYQFDWSNDDRGIVNQDTLLASATSKHETWQVSVRAVTNPYGEAVLRDVVGIAGPAGTAEVTILNSPPVATADTVETDEKTSIAIPVIVGHIPARNGLGVNPDTDADGDELRVKSVTQPTKGTVTIAGNGVDILFDPNGQFDYLAPGDEENVAFDYIVTDDDAIDEGTDTATVTVTVTGVNDPATALNLTVTTDIDTVSDPFTVEVDDPDQAQTHDFVLHDSAAPAGADAPPALKAPDNGTVAFAGASGGSIGQTDLLYTPDVGFTGVDSFEFAAWDGYAYSTIGTVTVVVGTPLWYPYFDLNDLLATNDVRVGLSADSWYRIAIVDATGKTVVDTSIFGTEMNPIDYFRAGSEGLLPGIYTVYFETWDPGTGAFGDQDWEGQIVVNDYGYADFPEDLAVVPPISRVGMGTGVYIFEFRAMNGRGYILKLYRNGQLHRTFRNVFLPSEDGKLIPLNQLTSLEVKIDQAGEYTAEVRAFNPLDESVEGNLSRADTPGPRWSTFDAFTVVVDGDVTNPAPPAGQVFPNGHVFVAPSGSIEISLQWNPIPNAVSYRLYLGAGSAAPIFDGEQVGATTSWRVNVPLGSYIWQVVGVNAKGNGIWSAPYVFDVVRDTTTPLIRRVSLADDDRAGNALWLEYAPDSVAAAKVDIQHYQTVDAAGWKVYNNVPVTSGDYVLVPGAQFEVGDYILVRAYSASGKRTDYRVFVIE